MERFCCYLNVIALQDSFKRFCQAFNIRKNGITVTGLRLHEVEKSLTSSSGEGTLSCIMARSFSTSCRNLLGYPLNRRVSCTCLRSCCLPSLVLGSCVALCKRVFAVLALCHFS